MHGCAVNGSKIISLEVEIMRFIQNLMYKTWNKWTLSVEMHINHSVLKNGKVQEHPEIGRVPRHRKKNIRDMKAWK